MTLRPTRRLLAAAAVLLIAGGAQAQNAPVAPAATQAQNGVPPEAITAGVARQVAHRAAYRLSLGESRNSGITAVTGAMVFDVQDACEGWATRQRMTMTVTDRDGQDVETVSDYATYEAKDNSRLRFSLTQSTGGAVSQRVAGEAELKPDGSGVVRYSEPSGKEERLPASTMLPTRHTVLAIETARAGRRLMAGPLFDGTTEEGAQDTTTIILGWTPPSEGEPRFPLLAGQGSARMRIAFFQHGNNSGGASAPDYEVGLRYYENGVADELVMDFGEFSVRGELLELQAVPGGC